MKSFPHECRREFLKTTVAGGLAAVLATRFNRMARAQSAVPATPAAPPAGGGPCKVALTTGDQRTDNIVRALKSLEKEIARAIGNRRVIIKPNNVSTTNQLSSTHVDALDGILDFLKSIGKLENALVAESALGGSLQSFATLGYTKLADKYNIKLVDLDRESFQTLMAFSERDARPHPVRVSRLISNQGDNFIISACMLKTHDRAICTLGLKNIIVGAALKFNGGRTNDKPILHGDGYRGMNVNLAMSAPTLHPSLTVIDGFQGMEGNGPLSGTAVDHRVCVASLDYLAADVVGAALMGIDLADVGYLTYLSTANVGESDVSKMEILGEAVAKLSRKYRLHPAAQQQMVWKIPARVAGT
jgi:uncharacterized protein (DUF362 family)